MRIYIINGPNLNMLGIREPEHYGTDTYKSLVKSVKDAAKQLGIRVKLYQSNHEGDLVDSIQRAYKRGAEGIVINPGAYTHTSIALLDALKSTRLRAVEVHVSKIEDREDFRQASYVRSAVEKTITGHGILGYTEALEHLVNH